MKTQKTPQSFVPIEDLWKRDTSTNNVPKIYFWRYILAHIFRRKFDIGYLMISLQATDL